MGIQIDVDLIKQRIARSNQGKSGGFRSILVFRSGNRIIFVYGFAKSDQSNIRGDELKAFKLLASELLSYSDSQLEQAVHQGALIEVQKNEPNL